MASDAVFTYKVDGFWNASEWGNYFTVENSHGFRLVRDDHGLLFAHRGELDRVKHFYSVSSESVLSENDRYQLVELPLLAMAELSEMLT